jgi:hypothetical protein
LTDHTPQTGFRATNCAREMRGCPVRSVHIKPAVTRAPWLRLPLTLGLRKRKEHCTALLM